MRSVCEIFQSADSMVTSMREPPITQVEVITSPVAGTATQAQASKHTNAYKQRRRATAAWNRVQIIGTAEQTPAEMRRDQTRSGFLSTRLWHGRRANPAIQQRVQRKFARAKQQDSQRRNQERKRGRGIEFVRVRENREQRFAIRGDVSHDQVDRHSEGGQP